MHSRKLRSACSLVLAVAMAAGCAAPPYVGRGPHPQIVRGRDFAPVDALGNVLSVFHKIILWDWRFNLHSISPETEAALAEYIDSRKHLQVVGDAEFRLNQYNPVDDFKRLARNRHVAWPYRLLLGGPTWLVFETVLPGRLFPWGDYYNPFSNTAHLYSDHPAVSLHEAGHVRDFAEAKWKGTYALARIVPGVDLWQEFAATDEALDYLKETEERETEIRAYKILYPAYATYVGGYAGLFAPLVIVGGHVLGRSVAAKKAHDYRKIDSLPQTDRDAGVSGATEPTTVPARSVTESEPEPAAEPSTVPAGAEP